MLLHTLLKPGYLILNSNFNTYYSILLTYNGLLREESYLRLLTLHPDHEYSVRHAGDPKKCEFRIRKCGVQQ